MRYFILIIFSIWVFLHSSAQTKSYSPDYFTNKVIYDNYITSKIGNLEKRIYSLIEMNPKLKKGKKDLHLCHIYRVYNDNILIRKQNYLDYSFLDNTRISDISVDNRSTNGHYIWTKTLVLDSNGDLVAVGDARQLFPFVEYMKKEKALAKILYCNNIDCLFTPTALEDTIYFYSKNDSLCALEWDSRSELLRTYAWEDYIEKQEKVICKKEERMSLDQIIQNIVSFNEPYIGKTKKLENRIKMYIKKEYDLKEKNNLHLFFIYRFTNEDVFKWNNEYFDLSFLANTHPAEVDVLDNNGKTERLPWANILITDSLGNLLAVGSPRYVKSVRAECREIDMIVAKKLFNGEIDYAFLSTSSKDNVFFCIKDKTLLVLFEENDTMKFVSWKDYIKL